MKTIICKLFPFIWGLLFIPLASCGGDGDEPEQGAVSGDKTLLLGGWEISNLEDVTIFMKNNKIHEKQQSDVFRQIVFLEL